MSLPLADTQDNIKKVETKQVIAAITHTQQGLKTVDWINEWNCSYASYYDECCGLRAESRVGKWSNVFTARSQISSRFKE